MFNQFKLLGAATLALAVLPSLAQASAFSTTSLSTDSVDVTNWAYDLTSNNITMRNPTLKDSNNPNNNALFLNVKIDQNHKIIIDNPVIFKNTKNLPIDVVVDLNLPDHSHIPLSINQDGKVKDTYVSSQIIPGQYYIGFNKYENNRVARGLNRNIEAKWNNDYSKLALTNIYLEDMEHIQSFEKSYIDSKKQLDNDLIKVLSGLAGITALGLGFLLTKDSNYSNSKKFKLG